VHILVCPLYHRSVPRLVYTLQIFLYQKIIECLLRSLLILVYNFLFKVPFGIEEFFVAYRVIIFSEFVGTNRIFNGDDNKGYLHQQYYCCGFKSIRNSVVPKSL
jgi:hypothetical protein